MMADKNGCTCYDETTRKCPIHNLQIKVGNNLLKNHQLVKQEIIRKARYKLRDVEGAVVDFFARVEPVNENGKEGWWVEASVWVDKVEDCEAP